MLQTMYMMPPLIKISGSASALLYLHIEMQHVAFSLSLSHVY